MIPSYAFPVVKYPLDETDIGFIVVLDGVVELRECARPLEAARDEYCSLGLQVGLLLEQPVEEVVAAPAAPQTHLRILIPIGTFRTIRASKQN